MEMLQGQSQLPTNVLASAGNSRCAARDVWNQILLRMRLWVRFRTVNHPQFVKGLSQDMAKHSRLPSLSLMFFATDDATCPDNRYRLVIQASRMADELGFESVWFPERHFHQFGGPFPNPAVLAGAIAAITSRVRIRAGSVVLPLHDPIRVAEEWSMVDNLSGGRIDLAFATGWDADSFILSPQRFSGRVDETFALSEIVARLWRLDAIERHNGNGQPISVRIHPPPIQKDLRIWITATQRTELFARAGTAGYNILTALLFQSLEELSQRVGVYRDARRTAGHDPDTGVVTLMLHSFVADDSATARQIVREPMLAYLKSSIDLWRHESSQLASLGQRERSDVLELAFERYLRTASLIGDPSHCLNMLSQATDAGVDEIACLIDFGPSFDQALQSIQRLASLT